MPRRERITFTVRSDLLAGLDQLVDHDKIRNRSHALEHVLSRSLGHKTHQAVILASGAGVKMRPFTYEIPKPLIPVGGRPLLEYTIELLRQHEIRDIIITVSYRKESIIQHFGDGSKFGVHITYAHENEPSGTAGALKAAKPYLRSAPFLVMYGDLLVDLDLTEFLRFHQENSAAVATIALTSVPDPSEYGSVWLQGARVASFSEKPDYSLQHPASHLVFTGIMAADPALWQQLPKKKGELSLEKDVFPQLVQEKRLYGFPFEGQWFDVSTPEIYERALKEWKQ